MSEYWLISAPAEKNVDENWKILNKALEKLNKCDAYKFYIPALKVGTLDTLLSDADEMVKLEQYLDNIISRLATSLESLIDDEKLVKKDLLCVEGEQIHEYLISFKWDLTKFPPKQTIKCLINLAQKQAVQIDIDYKNRMQEYVTVRGALEIIEKNDQGSLLTRNVNDLVTEKDFILNSEFMCTVLVVVVKKLYSDWLRTYERFDQTVLPRSSRVLAEDHEFYLIGVTLFKERVKHFSDTAKKFKFVVRDYVYNEQARRQYKENYLRIKKKKESLYEPLVKDLKHKFSEIVKSMIHIKACKLYVESVLRYGLPANFEAALLVINKKFIKKIREILHHLYKHLGITGAEAEKLANVEVTMALGQSQEYYPYVCYKINIDVT